jgi:hypothetical protein
MDQSNIFLSNIHEESLHETKRLPITLNRAGFVFSDEHTIENTLCSVQFIGKSYNNSSANLSESEQHFESIKNHCLKNTSYKSFIWLPSTIDYSSSDKNQLKFINKIENSLTNNMILSRAASTVQFVEDIKLILEQQPKKKFDTTPTDVFIIASQIDENDLIQIQKMLSGIIKTIKLTIVQDSDTDYEEYASQQMSVSKLSVIYFKNNSAWALSFAQQIWKKIGGASSNTSILLIGDLDNPENNNKQFNAPKVISMCVPNALIPLEIKIQFDNLIENS